MMPASGTMHTHQAIFIHMCMLIIVKEGEAMDGGHVKGVWRGEREEAM